MKAKAFYIYTHARPDGSIFYVGKGSDRRAYDFAQSRRTLHHLNIVRKYGRDSIIISIIPQASEDAAFTAERELIAALKDKGVRLVNLTDGGEGTSGRPMSPAQIAGFAKGRGKDRVLSDDSRKRIDEGRKIGQRNAQAWRMSPDGQAHIRRLGQLSAEATARRDKRDVTCGDCGSQFKTVSFKATYCSKLCQQRAWRKVIKEMTKN